MKVSDWIPEELVAPLTWLGKHDWLKFASVPDTNKTTLDRNLPPIPPGVPDAHTLIRAIALAESLDVTTLYCASKSLASGPKLLRPRYVECAALEHVALEITFDDYQQPYPTVLVEFPAQYRQELTERFGVKCPRGVICHHEKSSGYIFCITDAVTGPTQIVDTLTPRPTYEFIEQSLNAPADEGQDIEQGKVLQRVAMNLCLMLTITGCKMIGPSDPKLMASIKKRLRRTKRGKDDRLRRAKQAMPTLITFEQSIDFYLLKGKSLESESETTDADGTPRKPHWRRGHYRMQRFGPGRSQARLQFIRPILVNRHLFSGDEANTTVAYLGKQAPAHKQSRAAEEN